MYTEWTTHLQDPKEKEEFKKYVQGSKPLLERLKDILENKLQAIDRTEMNIAVYDTPNWAERQAHKNGNRESLSFLLKLVDLDQQKLKETK